MTEQEDQQAQKHRERKKLREYWLIVFFIFVIVVAGYGFYQPSTNNKEPVVTYHNGKIDNTSPRTDSLFDTADPKVYQLARKIERKEPITLEEVKVLPEGALNARYGQEITLLFHALSARNLQAIDVLLAAGADPYMIDQPSKGSARDFTYYTATVTIVNKDNIYNEEESKKFRYELTKIYLKNGGKADHIIPGKNPLSLLFMHTMKKNYASTKLLIDNGANPLQISNLGHSAIMSLVTDYNEEGLKLLKYITCKNFFMNATYEQVEHTLKWFEPSGPKNLERERKLRELSMLILKENPEFSDNSSTQEIFGGPIPWVEIRALKRGSVCHE